MELKVGDRVRDNDPRMKGRVLEVLEMLYVRGWVLGIMGRRMSLVPGAVIGAPGRLSGRSRVRLDRIHTDGKPRRSGWSLVPTTPTTPA